MKIKFFIFFYLAFISCISYANSFHSIILNTNASKSIQQSTSHKSEFIIKNDTSETIWVLVGSEKELVAPGFVLTLYNDEIEVSEIRIKMTTKSPFSEPFFNQLVPNHVTLYVSNYLPK